MKKLNFIYLFIFFVTLFLGILIYNITHHKNWIFYVENIIGSKIGSVSSLFIDDNSVYFSDQAENIFSLNKNTGNVNWIFKNHKNTPYPITFSDKIYLSNFDSHVYKLGRTTGYPVWSFAIPNRIQPDTQVITDDNDKLLFFADRSGVLYALNKETSEIVWTKTYKSLDLTKELSTGYVHFGTISQNDDYLFVGNSPEGVFQIINKSDGSILFSTKVENIFTPYYQTWKTYLIMINSHEYVVVDKANFKILSYIKSENLNSRFDIYNIANSENDIIVDNGSTVKRINILGNKVLWEYQIDLHHNVAVGGYINKYLILQGPAGNSPLFKIQVIDVNSGRKVWELNNLPFIQNITPVGTSLIVNTKINTSLVIDIETGRQISTIKTEGVAKRVFEFKDVLIIVTEHDNKKAIIYALDKGNLNTIWVFRSNYIINSSKIHFDANRLYLVDQSSKLIQSLEISKSAPKHPVMINFKILEKFGIFKPGLDYMKSNQLMPTIVSQSLQYAKRLAYVCLHVKDVFTAKINTVNNSSGVVELSINHNQNLYSNYFTNVKIVTTFVSPSNKKYQIDGYYYDFNNWKVNFSPQEQGEWKWYLTIYTPYSIINKKGNFDYHNEVREYLQVKDGNFVSKGKVFIPVGFQDWLPDNNYNGNTLDEMGYARDNSPSMIAKDNSYISFGEYIKLYKKEAGFNFYRINTDNWGPSLLRNMDLFEFDISINDAKVADTMLTDLTAQEYKVIFSMFGFFPPFQDDDKTKNLIYRKQVENYLDYVIARYSAYVDVWEIANEASISLEWQNYISDYINKKDIYSHPITTNWQQVNLKNSELLSVHWYSPLETRIANVENQVSHLKSLYSDWGKLVLISEFGFKGKSYSDGSGDQLRLFTWLSIFNNMGITYWNQPYGINTNPDNANVFLGPIERKYLSNLQKFLPKMTPPLQTWQIDFDREGINAYLLTSQEYTLGYLINQKENCQQRAEINLDITKPGKLEWYDTLNGKVLTTVDLEVAKNIKVPTICLDLAFRITHP